jgi:hypothetical protein
MNPVPVMKLVEIISGIATTEETKKETLELAAQMGKVTTESRDVAGFIANRILCPYLNEAVQAVYEVCGKERGGGRTSEYQGVCVAGEEGRAKGKLGERSKGGK